MPSRERRPPRRKKRKQARSKTPPGRSGVEVLPPSDLADAQRLTEGVFRAIRRGMDEREFDSLEDLQEYVESFRGPIDDLDAGGDDAERAQALAYEAMNAASPEEAIALLREALQLDPHCTDAQAALAELTSRSPADYARAMERVVQEAEAHLGARFFETERGYFWGLLETRPYMRAREHLAYALWDIGREREAADHLQEMLALNPNDNQGLRQVLLGWSLAMGDLELARRLFHAYPDEISAVFAWSQVLERLLAGEADEAERALRKARQANPHAEPYLSGAKLAPRELPEFYSPGEESEALSCAALLAEAWERHAEAQRWLAQHAAGAR